MDVSCGMQGLFFFGLIQWQANLGDVGEVPSLREVPGMQGLGTTKQSTYLIHWIAT